MSAWTILVVDDEPDLEQLINQRFRRQVRAGEYAFVFARDGVEALRLIAADPAIDLVLSDINMPVMDGLALRAVNAAKRLADGTAEESATSSGEMLLADIYQAFKDAPVPRVAPGHGPRLSSEQLATKLAAMEGRPWCEMGRGRQPLSKNQLARLLRDFGISPGSVRLDDGTTPKGYYLSAFDDAFLRYVPPVHHSGNATTPQAKEINALSQNQNATATSGVAFQTPENGSRNQGCGGAGVPVACRAPWIGSGSTTISAAL